MADSLSLLVNIVRFTGLVVNVPTSLPHLLNINGTPVVPQVVMPRTGSADVSVTSTHVIVTRLPSSGADDSVDVFVEYRHSMVDATPDLSAVQPFILRQQEPPGIVAAPSITFVFRPGDIAHNNVYTDWNLLMAAVGAVDGMKNILFDDTLVTPVVIPAGTYNMRNVILSGLLFRPVFVQVNEGVIFQELRQLDANVIMTFVGTTPPIQDLSNGDVLLLQRGAEFHTTGAGPFISLGNLTPGQGVIIVLRDGARFSTGTAPILDIPVAGTSATIAVIGALSELQPNTVSGVVGSLLFVASAVNFPLGVASVNQPAFLGTVIFQASAPRYNVQDVLTADNSLIIGSVNRCDPTGGAFNVSLPPAFDNSGQTVIVKNVSASVNAITVLPDGADTVDGAASQAITTARGSLTFVSDGISDWMIVSTV